MNSQDYLGIFANQILDNDMHECTALTVADLVGNQIMKPQNPDFTYAMTLKTMGIQPTTAGANPLAAMQSAVVYGTLPATDATFTTLTESELYVANWQNYSAGQRQFAEVNAQNGIKELDTFQDITNWLSLNKGGVGIPMLWYPSFLNPNANGTLLAPSGTPTNHMVSCFYSDGRGLQIKPHLGKDFGQNGYVYLSQALFEQVGLPYQYSYAFNQNASRWFSLAMIALQHWSIIPDVLPFMKALQA